MAGLCMCLMLWLCACGTKADEKATSASEAMESVDLVTEDATQLSGENAQTEHTNVFGTEDTNDAGESDTGKEEEQPASSDAENNNGKVLVVYFSHTGTTRDVSEYLHEVVGGDLIEIEPVSPYPAGYSDALDPAKKEQRENARPAIANTIEDFDSYEIIYLGYPIWWGTTPMIINTLMESYDFSGKVVIPYATSGGTGISQSIRDIRDALPGADVKDGILVKSHDDIIPWLQELGLYE